MGSHSVKTREDVERFLHRFLPKMDIFGVIFLDREKNREGLKMLGITASVRKQIIKSVTPDDYVENILDDISLMDMWVFGKDYDDTELYVKISLGKPNSNTICISFHVAEYPLKYAFKKGGEHEKAD